jgi:hypothetical protein
VREHSIDHRVGRLLSFFPVVGIGTPPTPHPQASVPPPPFGSGGRGKLAGEKRSRRVPIPMRGHTLWYSVYMYFVSTDHIFHSLCLPLWSSLGGVVGKLRGVGEGGLQTELE